MLVDPPESLVDELNRRWTAYKQATANQTNYPSAINLLIRNTATNALNKTLDKCTVELGLPLLPRPTVQEQEGGALKLLYAAS